MEHLYKITDQGEQYVLGEIIKDFIYYDFEKTLTYLEDKGKFCYGQNFRILEQDQPIQAQAPNCFYVAGLKRSGEKR
jgi:hypothetical protein